MPEVTQLGCAEAMLRSQAFSGCSRLTDPQRTSQDHRKDQKVEDRRENGVKSETHHAPCLGVGMGTEEQALEVPGSSLMHKAFELPGSHHGPWGGRNEVRELVRNILRSKDW